MWLIFLDKYAIYVESVILNTCVHMYMYSFMYYIHVHAT